MQLSISELTKRRCYRQLFRSSTPILTTTAASQPRIQWFHPISSSTLAQLTYRTVQLTLACAVCSLLLTHRKHLTARAQTLSMEKTTHTQKKHLTVSWVTRRSFFSCSFMGSRQDADGLRCPAVKTHNDAGKKRFVVHALDDEDWSPRFVCNCSLKNDWTAVLIDVIEQ